MSTDSINIAISSATLIVVGVASIAAIVQLRHLRTSNQLNGMLEILNQWNLPTVQSALAELQKIPAKMKDPQYVQTLDTPQVIDREHYREFLAMDLWEQIGTFVKRDLIDEDTLLDITSGQISYAWQLCEPVIVRIRAKVGSSAFENFEYLAVRAEIWKKQYPDGTYPARLPRMSDL